MTTIEHLQGDATRRPVGPGPKIIAHICNDVGGWGRGFVEVGVGQPDRREHFGSEYVGRGGRRGHLHRAHRCREVGG